VTAKWYEDGLPKEYYPRNQQVFLDKGRENFVPKIARGKVIIFKIWYWIGGTGLVNFFESR
jgi:hypothetical protein